MKNPPAFPRPFSWDESPNTGTTCGDRAAPHEQQDGMTLRDYFAGQALASTGSYRDNCANLARWAYEFADAMLAQRERTAAPVLLRQANNEEHIAMLECFAARQGVDVVEEMPDSDAYVREHFTTDGPGYSGPVGMLHFHGAPGYLYAFTRSRAGGWEYQEER